MTPAEKYDDFLMIHKGAVLRAYDFLVENGIVEHSDELEHQIQNHDESKYSEEEWEAYLNKFYIPEQHNENEFKYAWLHHQHNNPHHPQYWCLQEDDKPGELEVLEMPYNYIVEMVCDWLSFSIMKQDLTLIDEWYKDKGHKHLLGKKTRKTVEKMLGQISRNIT